MIFKTAQATLEQARALIRQATAQVLEVTGTLGTTEQVTLGYLLWDLNKRTAAALEPIKKAIRERAFQETTDRPATVILSGFGDALCQVVFPRETVKVPAKNVAALKELLGERFPDLFQEVVTYKPKANFQEILSELPEDIERGVLRLVQVVESTPRVGFQQKDR